MKVKKIMYHLSNICLTEALHNKYPLQFSSRVKLLTTAGLTKGDRIGEVIKQTVGTITKAEIMKKCPDISQITIQRALIELQEQEKIIKIGGGRYTKYTWNWDKENQKMITGELKNRIDSLWEIFWTGGLTNPLDVIEQMTYLMFIHDQDVSDNTHAKESAMLGLPYESVFSKEVKIGERTIDGTQLKWSVFRDYPADSMYSVVQEMVFPFIKNLHANKDSAFSKYMDDAIFKLPTPLMLSKVVDAMDDLYTQMAKLNDSDARGDVYEYLLSKQATAGVNGQFRTPRHIIRMMVELMEPKADDVICDPSCGTAGFLVESGEYLWANKKDEIFYDKQKKDHFMNHMFHGFDMDRTMLRIGYEYDESQSRKSIH